MTKDEMENLCNRLDFARRQLIEAEGDDPDDASEYRLYPAATRTAIDEAERKSGWNYGPSYKVFLSLHNGWLNCWPDWSLVGIPRADNRSMQKDIAENLSKLPVVANDTRQKQLAEEEKTNKKLILITNHPVVGIDFNGGLLLADQNHFGKNGEPELAWVGNWLNVERRWKNFERFLKDAIADTQADFKQASAKPRKSKRAAAMGAQYAAEVDDAFAAVERELARRREEKEAARKKAKG